MKNVFMAVAIDLGEPNAIFGPMHPGDKQDVGYRLALGGRAVAYNEVSLYYTGPIASRAASDHTSPWYIVVSFSNVSNKGLELRSNLGFEICCIKAGQPTWMETYISENVGNSVFIDNFCGAGNLPAYVRYSWKEDPCVFKKCAVYSGDLPSPPFILPVAPSEKRTFINSL